MRHQLLVFRALVLAVIAGLLGCVPSFAQPAPPTLRDGHPSLEGVWTNNTATPLERPEVLKDRPTLTDAEVRDLQERAARFLSNSQNDFAAGDNFFLAVWTAPPIFKSPNATGGANEIVEKVFENRTSLIVDPLDGRVPAWTAEGRQRWDKQREAAAALRPDGPEALSNVIRCTTYGVPLLGGNSADYSNYFQIVQTREYVVLYGEAIHDARVIPLDGRPHLPAELRRWNGDSVGRWEGNTFVIDTTNFSRQSRFMGAAENLHVIERLTRASSDVIDYQITLDDPTTWAKPWTALIHLRRTNDKMYEFACHEGNLEVIRDVLAGARAEERAAEASAKKPQ